MANTAVVEFLATPRDTTFNRQPFFIPLRNPRHQPHASNPCDPTSHLALPRTKEARGNNPHRQRRRPSSLLSHPALRSLQTRTFRLRAFPQPPRGPSSIIAPAPQNQSQRRSACQNTDASLDGKP